MLFYLLANPISRCLGCLYPAYMSYKAIRTKNPKEYQRWMIYWAVFGCFMCVEMWTDIFLCWLPFYYEVKLLFILWLIFPKAHGSLYIFQLVIKPFFSQREQYIDYNLEKASEYAYISSRTVGAFCLQHINSALYSGLTSSQSYVASHFRSLSLTNGEREDDIMTEEDNNSTDRGGSKKQDQQQSRKRKKEKTSGGGGGGSFLYERISQTLLKGGNSGENHAGDEGEEFNEDAMEEESEEQSTIPTRSYYFVNEEVSGGSGGKNEVRQKAAGKYDGPEVTMVNDEDEEVEDGLMSDDFGDSGKGVKKGSGGAVYSGYYNRYKVTVPEYDQANDYLVEDFVTTGEENEPFGISAQDTNVAYDESKVTTRSRTRASNSSVGGTMGYDKLSASGRGSKSSGSKPAQTKSSSSRIADEYGQLDEMNRMVQELQEERRKLRSELDSVQSLHAKTSSSRSSRSSAQRDLDLTSKKSATARTRRRRMQELQDEE